MRRLFKVLLIGIALAALIIQGLQFDLGYVRIVFHQWIIESNVWVWLGFNVLLVTSLWFVINLVSKLGSGASNFVSWRSSRSKLKAENETSQGLLAFLEGYWSEAYRLLSHSAKNAKDPLINYLGAAHAAGQLGKLKAADAQLKKAYNHKGSSDFAVALTQANIQIKEQDYESALATLRRLNQQRPKHPHVLKLMSLVFEKLEDWSSFLSLRQEMRHLGIIDQNVRSSDKDIETNAWGKLFTQETDKLLVATKHSQDSENLAEIWMRVPQKLRYDGALICVYAEQLHRLDMHNDAETLLRKVLGKQWSVELVNLYGKTVADDAKEQLICAEKWLRERPNDAPLLLSLGRIAMRNELWGKAAEYFSASQQQTASLDAAAELCRLYQHLEKPPEEMLKPINELIKQIQLPNLKAPRVH
jgi:HemY protein